MPDKTQPQNNKYKTENSFIKEKNEREPLKSSKTFRNEQNSPEKNIACL